MPTVPATPIDTALRARAQRVIPGGMTGHLNAAYLPPNYPQFFARGDGCRLWDVDGREFIDFMCSWGPNLLGHHHPEVEAAAARQRALGDCLNGPTARMVELAERLVERIAHADWVMFQKNGTDATTVCLTIARAATGKRKILVASKAYHGSSPWCTPSPAGVTAEDRAHLIEFTYNDVASLEAAADAAGPDLAGVMVSAFKHDIGVDLELPTREFAQRVRALCTAKGAALMLDEVRAGYRLHAAGSWEPLGVRPDLSAWSKAIANGHALAAVAGTDALRDAATRFFSTGSFWAGGVAVAAALATLDIAEREEPSLIAHLERMGQRLRQGIAEQAKAHGVKLRQSGPPQMPLILFDDDPRHEKGTAFCAAALQRGVYLHPRHNIFVCLAHGEQEIDRALEATEGAFRAVGSDRYR
jgi:glutamate-1-semialdehyde 2,1-aminomutase